MNEKRYTEDGFLIVSESDRCASWEKDAQPCRCGCVEDCFFCKFSDFRTPEYRERMVDAAQTGKLYSVCRNERNKKTTIMEVER